MVHSRYTGPPIDGTYRAVDEIVRMADDEGRADISDGPLLAVAIRVRAISPRTGRYLATQVKGEPLAFSLRELRDRWRDHPFSDPHRQQKSPRLVENALRALLEIPAPLEAHVDTRTAATVFSFAKKHALDGVLDLSVDVLPGLVGKLPETPPSTATTLRALCSVSPAWRDLVAKAVEAELYVRDAQQNAAARVVVESGDDVERKRAILDELWAKADAFGAFEFARSWVSPGPAQMHLSSLGLTLREYQREGYPAIATVTVSPRGVVVEGADDDTKERALRLLHDVIAEPEGQHEASLVRAMLTPKHQVLLDALSSLAPHVEREREERIAWVVERDDWNRLQVYPIAQKALKRGGGFTKGSRISPRDVVDGRGTEQDQQVASIALSHSIGSWNADELRALKGHAFVYVDGEREKSWSIDEKRIEIAFKDDDGGYSVALEAGGVRVDAERVTRSASSQDRSTAIFDDDNRRIVISTITPAVRDVAAALRQSDGFIPIEVKEQLVVAVHRASAAAPLSLPPSLEGERRVADDRIYARLIVDENAPLVVRIGVRPAPGGALVPPGTGDAAHVGIVEQKRTIFDRDLVLERERAAALRDELLDRAHDVDVDEDWTLRCNTDDAALSLLEVLHHERAGVVVEWKDPRRKLRVEGLGTAASLRVGVRGVEGWLGVDGEMNVAGHVVSLALLLESVRLGRRFVKVADGAFIALADELRARLKPIAAFSVDENSDEALVHIAPSAALALDDLAQAGAHFDESKMWLELQQRAERARSVDDVPPDALLAELRPYQRQGLLFLRRLAAWGTGGVLADDMGLGKTLQATAALVDRAHEGPQLVVAPTSVCFNWQRELERFAPSLRVRVVESASSCAKVVSDAKAGDVVVTSYGVAVLAEDALCARKLASVVFDEAQAVKNADTQRAKMAHHLDAAWKIALSGTPLENRLGELWSMFRVVSPGLLGSAEKFRERFVVPIERDRSAKKRQELAQTLRPFLLRRTRDEVLPELPRLTEVVVPVELDDAERALYDAARAAVLLDVGAELEGAPRDRRFRVLAGLTRLRLLCCHRALVDGGDAVNATLSQSSKHREVLHALAHVKENGHRALVFSQFVKHLDIVEKLLADAGFRTLRLDGSTPAAERARLVDEFQAGRADAFLISLKAGGAGLNLTAADYVFHLDPWWNPAVEDQATARAHRIGQDKPVTVYRFVARGTIEEQMLAMHEEKRDLVDSILEGADAAAHLSLDELIAMLR